MGTAVPMSKQVRTVYHGEPTVDVNEKQIQLFSVSFTVWKTIGGINIATNLVRRLGPKFLSLIDSYMVVPKVNEINCLLVHCELYHMQVNPNQKS